MTGDPKHTRPRLSPHVGCASTAELSHGNMGGFAHRLPAAKATFCQGKKETNRQPFSFTDSMSQAAVSAKDPGEDRLQDQTFCKRYRRRKRYCKKQQPQENLESSPPQNHVWSFPRSPRLQTPGSRSLLSSETLSILI